MILQTDMASKKVIVSEIAEETIGRYFENYRIGRYGSDMPMRALNYSRIRSALANIDAFFDDIYTVNNRKYIEIENIGIVEFSMEENQSEILIKNIYFKNL
jgi:hypothetical protein